MVQSLFADFAKIFPTRFCNVTNGVTPRRWLALANPPLSDVLDENIGRTWRTDLSQLSELKQHCDYPLVNHAVRQAKLENKKRLAVVIAQQLNVVVNPKALFDVQIKRIHEYKRQLMNVLHVITRYNRIKENPEADWVPRVNIFAGKAASAYYMAKHIIHLINDVAKVINNDPQIGDKLKVVFIPNYSVSLAQVIIPAADLSEQISLAGTEASGTSNMKFALNGALTIGTLDGANVEMQEHVGEENIFIFGNTAEEVEALRRQGYKPRDYYEKDEELHQVLTQIGSGVFNPEEPGRYRDLVDSLINFGDHYQVLADYRSYVDCQDKVDELYRRRKSGRRKRCSTLPIWATSHRTEPSKSMPKISGILIRCGCSGLTLENGAKRPRFLSWYIRGYADIRLLNLLAALGLCHGKRVEYWCIVLAEKSIIN